ncbi:hypothetical protein [Streptomyces fulvoviolaceus]|uniref:hypothetical protein n=1 Tax=Streptomyces fulvoviolaceus TaxID=285535 RepID=UPI0004C71C56|nr:hypothetical protein [Streptomyces fulvoviolaceus]MCT9075778.1 hypothetical protein [Streptomyces fulvoviolaceus]
MPGVRATCYAAAGHRRPGAGGLLERLAYADHVRAGVGARVLDEEERVERRLLRVVEQGESARHEVFLAQ